MTRDFGIGAQFGGKYFCHDVASSACRATAPRARRDRGVVQRRPPGAREDHAEGVFLEQLETDPARFLPDVTDEHLDDEGVVKIDLNRPMDEIRAELSKYR